MPIYVSRGNFPPRYEVPKFLARGAHLCMAMLTIAVGAVVAGEFGEIGCALCAHCDLINYRYV